MPQSPIRPPEDAKKRKELTEIREISLRIASTAHPDKYLSRAYINSAWQIAELMVRTPLLPKTYRDWMSHSELTAKRNRQMLSVFQKKALRRKTRRKVGRVSDAEIIVMEGLQIGELRRELIDLFSYAGADEYILQNDELFQRLIVGLFLALVQTPLSAMPNASKSNFDRLSGYFPNHSSKIYPTELRFIVRDSEYGGGRQFLEVHFKQANEEGAEATNILGIWDMSGIEWREIEDQFSDHVGHTININTRIS